MEFTVQVQTHAVLQVDILFQPQLGRKLTRRLDSSPVKKYEDTGRDRAAVGRAELQRPFQNEDYSTKQMSNIKR